MKRWEDKTIPGWHTPTHEDPLYALATDLLFSSQPAYEGIHFSLRPMYN